MAELNIRSLISILISAATTFAMLIVSSAPASACSCAQLPAIEMWEFADQVFVGTQVDRTRHSDIADNGVSLFFEVSSVYKGEIGEVTEVFTHAQSSACGVDFAGAEDVLIVAEEWQGKPSVGGCTSMSIGDLEQLGIVPHAPDSDISPPPAVASRDSYWLAGGLTALAGMLIIVAILRLRDTNPAE